MFKKSQEVYTDILAEDTLLGFRKRKKGQYEVFVKYIEPNYSWEEHLCNLPEECFELGDNAIAVFKNSEEKLKLEEVYDINFHKFVVKDKVRKVYKERFLNKPKVKQK